MRRALVVLGLVAASLGLAPSALAACAGTERTVVVCVNPTGQILYSDCVVVVAPPCIPVDVPGPTIQCGGDIGQLLC